MARGGEPGAVTELGEDRDRGQPPDPVVRHQRLAPGLAARVGAQLLVERRDLHLERVDHRQRDRDLLARRVRQRLRGEPLAPVADHQLARAAGSRGDTASPGSAAATPSAAQRACAAAAPGRADRGCDRAGSTTPAAARPSTAPADAGRPHDRPSRASSGPCSPAVSAGSARCTTAPTRRSSSTTNRQPVVASNATSSSRPRKRDKPLAHGRAIRRRHARALHLAGVGVDPLAGDLSSMLIKSHYDAHKGPPQAPRFATPARTRSALELRRSLHVGSDGLLMTSFLCPAVRFIQKDAHGAALPNMPAAVLVASRWVAQAPMRWFSDYSPDEPKPSASRPAIWCCSRSRPPSRSWPAPTCFRRPGWRWTSAPEIGAHADLSFAKPAFSSVSA